MWIASQFGFFSIVKDMEQGTYKIRSRAKKDLLNFFPEDRIITSFAADYRHRVIADQTELDAFLARCAEIDYPNFKAHIATLPDQKDKVKSYAEIWTIMYSYQSKQDEK